MEEIIARALLQWLEHRRADMTLAYELLSQLRFGAVNPLELNQLTDAIVNKRTGISDVIDVSSTSKTTRDAAQLSIDQLVATLYHLSFMFGIQGSASPLALRHSNCEFPASSPIRHLLSLNMHSFLPRSAAAGVVVCYFERKLAYYKITPLTSGSSRAASSYEGRGRGRARGGRSSRQRRHSSQSEESDSETANGSNQHDNQPSNAFELSSLGARKLLVKMKLSPQFKLVAASYSRALNAFFLLHWYDASTKKVHSDEEEEEEDEGTEEEQEEEEQEDEEQEEDEQEEAEEEDSGASAQFYSPQQWAALDGSNYRTALSVYFPDKMTLCFSSGRELLAVPREDGALVMVRSLHITILYMLDNH